MQKWACLSEKRNIAETKELDLGQNQPREQHPCYLVLHHPGNMKLKCFGDWVFVMAAVQSGLVLHVLKRH